MKKLNSILLVDDDKASIYLTQEMLSEMEIANHIFVCKNGKEALQFIQDNCLNISIPNPIQCPDVIFLDINMPLMNGFEFLDALHNLPGLERQFMTIIMLTTSTRADDMNRAWQYNITEYIEKPLTEEKLQSLFDNGE